MAKLLELDTTEGTKAWVDPNTVTAIFEKKTEDWGLFVSICSGTSWVFAKDPERTVGRLINEARTTPVSKETRSAD